MSEDLLFEPESSDLGFTPTQKVDTFMDVMRHPHAPASFNKKVVERLKDWGLVSPDEPITNLEDVNELDEIIRNSRKKLHETELERKAFEVNPWNFDQCIEAEYTEAELPDKFPKALVIQSLLKEKVKFYFRAEPSQQYLRIVIREDGRRQVLRFIETPRSTEEINRDANSAPSIIPHFEAVKVDDTRTILFIDWIEGTIPDSPTMKAKCLKEAEDLMRVNMDAYDLWAGNFLVAGGNVFYVDRDVPVAIAKKGYREITDEVREKFENDKVKMRL